MKLKTALHFLTAIVLVLTGIGSIIYLSFNVVLQVVGAMGSWTAFGIFVFYLFTSVPAFQGAGAWIARGLSFWKTGAKSAVALKIQQSLNLAQEEINSEAKGIIPYRAKVEWVDKPSYLDTEDEVVVIRMKEYEENPRNIAYAVIDYISKGMVPYSRLYIEKPIQTAIDSIMVKKILLERDKGALDYFLTNVLSKALGQESVQHYIDIMNNLDGRGLFTRVYLEEAKELGLKLYPTPDQDALRETKEYVEHLNILATRKKGELGKADPYIGRKIKVAYVLIAEPEKLRREGFAPYVQYAMHCVEDGAEAIYLLSRGRKNRPATRLAESIAITCKMKITNVSEYKEIIEDDDVPEALCIELRKDKAHHEQEGSGG
jgi:hypothetical protein